MTSSPVALWEGQPSGERLAALLRARAEQLGARIEVEVIPWDFPGGFGVWAHWGHDAANSANYEVVDWVEDIRVLDTGDDVTLDQALDYFAARLSGDSASEALDRVVPTRPSLWSRLRRRPHP